MICTGNQWVSADFWAVIAIIVESEVGYVPRMLATEDLLTDWLEAAIPAGTA